MRFNASISLPSRGGESNHRPVSGSRSARTRGGTETIVIVVLIALFFGALLLNRRSGTVVHLDDAIWQSDLVSARAAATDDRPVLALFTADWCGPCQTLKSNVLTNPNVAADLSERVVPLYVDLTAPTKGSWQEQLAVRYAVQSIPTMIVLNADDEILSQRGGLMSAEAFTAWIDEVAVAPAE